MAEVVASVLAESAPEVLRRARGAAMVGADWIELRLDALPPDTDPHALLGEIALPVLVACRTPRDGGRFAGSLEQRRTMLQRWVDAGVAGLDLEVWESWTPAGAERLRLSIRSHHNLSGIDDNLEGIRDRLLDMGANVAKLAVTAPDLADAAPVLDLMASTDHSTHPTVAFAMGDDAWPTRVLACVHGAPFVYGSVAAGLGTAPGQVPVAWLTGLYDVRRFTASTMIYGVLGNPARDSWSPMLFNRAFRWLGHDAVYLPFTTAHPKAVTDMLSRRRLRGLSVTAPHKAALLRGCHEIDEAAAMSGALNTLVFRAHGSVTGHNTDVRGVREALTEAGLQGNGENAVVIGGGGAARAAAIALAQLGLVPVLMPRTLDTVREFAREHGFRLARLDAAVMDELEPLAVVHATPLGGPTVRIAFAAGGTAGSAAGGAAGGTAGSAAGGAAGGGAGGSAAGAAGASAAGATGGAASGAAGGAAGSGGRTVDPAAEVRVLPDWRIRPGTFVLNMVYQVRETPLLRAAAQAGAVPVPGVRMFLAQAAEQLHLFTGRRFATHTLGELVGGA